MQFELPPAPLNCYVLRNSPAHPAESGTAGRLRARHDAGSGHGIPGPAGVVPFTVALCRNGSVCDEPLTAPRTPLHPPPGHPQ
jgi:hypothetical protein